MINNNAIVKRFGSKLVNELADHNDESFLKMPLEFEYNQSWTVEFNSPKCVMSLSMIYDPEIFKFPRYNFQLTKYICSKYYDLSILKMLAESSEMLELLEINNSFYLADKNYFDLNFPVTSSAKLIKARCEHSDAFLLINASIFSPMPPSKEYPLGQLGKIVVREILTLSNEQINSLSEMT